MLSDTQGSWKEIFVLAEFNSKLILELRSNIKDMKTILNKKTDTLALCLAGKNFTPCKSFFKMDLYFY